MSPKCTVSLYHGVFNPGVSLFSKLKSLSVLEYTALSHSGPIKTDFPPSLRSGLPAFSQSHHNSTAIGFPLAQTARCFYTHLEPGKPLEQVNPLHSSPHWSSAAPQKDSMTTGEPSAGAELCWGVLEWAASSARGACRELYLKGRRWQGVPSPECQTPVLVLLAVWDQGISSTGREINHIGSDLWIPERSFKGNSGLSLLFWLAAQSSRSLLEVPLSTILNACKFYLYVLPS